MTETDLDLSALPPITIREFLYADLDRARSIMSQIVGGVPEEDKISKAVSKRFAIGAQNYLGYNREGKTEDHIQRSLLDALLPELEAILLAEGWLTDLTSILDNPSTTPKNLEENVHPGCLVKIDAEGQLFDAQYLAQVLGGISVATDGVHALSQGSTSSPISKGKKPRPTSGRVSDSQPQNLEDLIENFDPAILGGVGPDLFRSLVRVARGMFSSGLHLLLSPASPLDWAITVRLQEGKRYLDAERDVLFSRYGLSSQYWTVLGTIGHYAPVPAGGAFEDMNFLNQRGEIDRKKFVSGMNQLLASVAKQGISDSPAYPGFALVPIAVYRSIPQGRLT